jgi:uncharacterized protein YkuJ
MKYTKIKKLSRIENHYYTTDEGFEPNGPLKITVRVDTSKITNINGVYKIKIYRKESNSIEELDIASIEAFWIIDNIQELFKSDLTQFDRIHLTSVEYYTND